MRLDAGVGFFEQLLLLVELVLEEGLAEDLLDVAFAGDGIRPAGIRNAR